MATQYDDDIELYEYLRDCHAYSHLLTDVEKLAENIIAFGLKEKAYGSDWAIRERMQGEIRGLDDPRVVEALKDGPEEFRRRAGKRIRECLTNEIFINRCPNCDRIVATPKARQCLWCHHDWHTKTI